MSSLSVSELAGIQISKYANIGGLAILIFDYCITVQDEVLWTWSTPWDLPRVIFIISRYLPFVGTGMTAYAVLRVNGSCPPSLEENIIHIICIVAAEGLLLLRTWVFWQKSKKLLVGLLSYGLLTIIAVLIVNLADQLLPGGELFSSPSTEQNSTGPALLVECPFVASRDGALVYSFLAAYEIVILILTVYKKFHDYRNFQRSIINVVYRDGIVYILCIIAITVANVIVVAAFPASYGDMFDILQLVIHSVLASRILFHLRSSTHNHVGETPTTLLSEVIYDENPSNSWMTGTTIEA